MNGVFAHRAAWLRELSALAAALPAARARICGRRALLAAAVLLGLALPAKAAITVDGHLDEPEWQQAQHFSRFTTTVPNTRGEPALHTEVLVTTDATGINVGFICDQPPGVARTHSRSTRDQDVEADRVSLMVDFEGRGNTAYEFTVSISDGTRDAIIGNTLLTDVNGRQSRFNTDWDAAWDHAVYETADQWFVEFHLPWSVAPLGAARDGKLRLGMFFSRVVSSLGQRYSAPGSQLDRPTFIADMQPVTVDSFDSRQLDFFPYVSATRDFHKPGNGARAGLDVFWKPSPQHQLTATINPDFGQVEADALVVNFTAIPTFFPEKRPFFTENQSLFDTDTRLVYTRRIGAAPDLGSEGSSDIIGATKYTGATGSLEYGLIAAVEDKSAQSHGRDFFVGRARGKLGDGLSLGWLATHVEHPSLRRSADVQSLDFAWTLQPGVTLRGQGELSRIQRPDTGSSSAFDPEGTGNGGSLIFDYATGGAWAHNLTATHFSDRFFIDDAGFLERNNLNQLSGNSTYTFRSTQATGQVRESAITTAVQAAYNDQGQQLPASVDISFKTQPADASVATLEYVLVDLGGADDLLTRGNGVAKLPAQSNLLAGYSNPQTGLLRYTAQASVSQGLFNGVGYGATLTTELHFTEHFITRLKVDYTASPDFIIWQHDNLVSSFRYRQIIATTAVDWFPTPRQELRLLLQWSAGTGHALQGYRPVDGSGRLQATSDPVSSFSFADVPLQLRYRYALGPLSDLYVVYSRGGDTAREDANLGLDRLLGRAWREETASEVLVKLRYRFRSF